MTGTSTKGAFGAAELEALEFALELLANGESLPDYFQDHPLLKREANYAGLRECHLDADVLLIYRSLKTAVVLHRVGGHRRLFSAKAVFNRRATRREKKQHKWRSVQ